MLKSDEEVYREFGENLKKLRKEKNLTQTELANDLGMTQSAIYKYEKGLRKIPMSVLKQFANYFDLTLDELIDPTNELTENENPVKYKTHLTKYEVATELGFTKEEISVLESGVKQIPRSFFEKFANYFDVDIENLNALISLEAQREHAVITTDEVLTKRYKKWQSTIGYNHFTDEEIDQLIDYAQYLISKRK